jgi:hypothetical protein
MSGRTKQKVFVGQAFEKPANSKPVKKRPVAPSVSKRARALVRQQLKHGPRPESQIEAAAAAAEIPKRSLIDATDDLGVRTRRGDCRASERKRRSSQSSKGHFGEMRPTI